MTLAPRSETKLQGVHPDLVAVARRAAELGGKFHVTCGLRTLEEQKALLAAGKSKTLKSRHLTGHAIDVVAVTDDGVSYDAADMAVVARNIKAAAAYLNIPIEWGGDWKGFVDTPHFQLPWKEYPITGPAAVQQEAAKPLRQSGQIWSSLGAIGAGVSIYAEQTMAVALDAIAAMTSLEPLQAAMKQAGANAKALGLAVLVFCVSIAIGRRARQHVEGRQ